jgi:hypothetical protein
LRDRAACEQAGRNVCAREASGRCHFLQEIAVWPCWLLLIFGVTYVVYQRLSTVAYVFPMTQETGISALCGAHKNTASAVVLRAQHNG